MKMPHYKDGTTAQIGDQVFGKLYNTEGVRAGTIVSITPDVDSCNCMVEFLVSSSVSDDGMSVLPRMAIADTDGLPGGRKRRVKTQTHGSSGPEADVYVCRDYCAINELTRVGP
jgi:hypothetical protein